MDVGIRIIWCCFSVSAHSLLSRYTRSVFFFACRAHKAATRNVVGHSEGRNPGSPPSPERRHALHFRLVSSGPGRRAAPLLFEMENNHASPGLPAVPYQNWRTASPRQLLPLGSAAPRFICGCREAGFASRSASAGRCYCARTSSSSSHSSHREKHFCHNEIRRRTRAAPVSSPRRVRR
jgi:hypothetical protein